MEVKLVSNQFADKEDIVICPYNAVHTLPASRIQYHLQKCRQDKSNNITPEMQELLTCPFNAKHKFFAAEKAFHYRFCTDRTPVERHVHGGNLVKGRTSLPTRDIIHYPTPKESWEDGYVEDDDCWGLVGAPPKQPGNVRPNRDASSGLAEAGDGDRSVRRPATESNAMRYAKGMKPRTTLPASQRSRPRGRPDTRGLHSIDAAKLWATVPVTVLSEELQATIAHDFTEEDMEDMEDEYLSNNMATSGVGRGQGPPPSSLPAAGSTAPVGKRDPPLSVPANPSIARQSPVAPPQHAAATSISPGSIALKKVASARTVQQPAPQATPPVHPTPRATPGPVQQPAPQATPPVQPTPRATPGPVQQPASLATLPVQPTPQPTSGPVQRPAPQAMPPVQPTQPAPGPVQPKPQPTPGPVQQPAPQAMPPVQPIPGATPGPIQQPAPQAMPPVKPKPQATPGLQTPSQIPRPMPAEAASGTSSDTMAPHPPRMADSGQPAAIVRPLPAIASDAQPRRPRPLGRAAPQPPPLGASVPRPGIPPASQPRVQTPPPDLQDNSSALQEGVVESQPGFAEPLQGYPESQQGFPEPHQKFSEPQQGHPEPQLGYPEPQHGFAESQQGFPERQPLLPKPQQRFPEPQQGFSQQGVQPGVQGMPLSQQGTFWSWSTAQMATALPAGRSVNMRPPPGFGSVAQGAQVPATSPASSFSPAPSSAFSPAPSSAFSPAPNSAFSPASNSVFSPISNSAFSPAPNSAFSSTSASSYGSVPSSAYNPAHGPMFGPVPTPTHMYTFPLMSSYGEDSTSAYGHAPSPAFHSAPSPAFHSAPSPAFHQAPSSGFGTSVPSLGYGPVSRPGRPRAPGGFNTSNYGPSGSSYNSRQPPTFAPAPINRAPGARGPTLLHHHSPAPLHSPMLAAGRGAPGFASGQVEMGGMGRGLSLPGHAGPGGSLNPYSPWNSQFPPGSDQGGQ